MLAAAAKSTQGKVINIACGQSVTIHQVITTINRLLGTDLQPRYAPPRAGDILHSQADIALAREVIGYEPHIMFEDGLARAIEWYRANL